MGQAMDQSGNVLAEAFGATKKEVFDKLQALAPDAAEIRVRSMMQQLMKKESQMEEAMPPEEGPENPGDCDLNPGMMLGEGRRLGVDFARRRELIRLAESIAESLHGKVKPHELCILRQAVELYLARR